MGKQVHPLIALVANMVLDHFGMQPEESGDDLGLPELEDIPIVRGLRNKTGAVVLALGRRESGKSTMSHRLAQIIGRPTYAICPEQKPPEWIQELKIEQLSKWPPPYSTLILDDIVAYMSSRDYKNLFVQVVEKLIPVVRHQRKIILIFNSQTAGQADKWILDSDIIFFKAPNPLFEDIERPAVARIYRRLLPIFEGMSDQEIQRTVYLYSLKFKGLARVDKASVMIDADYRLVESDEGGDEE